MDISDLLHHHGLRLDEFGLIPLLPDLIASILFVGLFIELKLFEQCMGPLFLQKFEDLFGGEGFEMPHTPADIIALGHKVEMVFQYHVGVELITAPGNYLKLLMRQFCS